MDLYIIPVQKNLENSELQLIYRIADKRYMVKIRIGLS